MNEEDILKKMIIIYRPNGYDWMCEKITEENPLTSKNIVETAALLTSNSIKKLELLKNVDLDLYNEWEWLFMAINLNETHPIIAHNEMMNELRDETNNILNSYMLKK